jgi:serine/threonine-protein kinase RsbT
MGTSAVATSRDKSVAASARDETTIDECARQPIGGEARDDGLSSDLDGLTGVLTRYISAVNARALVGRALREHGVSSASVTRSDLRKCTATLRQGIDLFVTPAQRETALRDLSRFFGTESLGSATSSIPIHTEADVGTARSEARRLCDAAGTDPFTMQKIATIVSELARNIVLYAETGTIEMGPVQGNGRRLRIRAVDKGPGIPNLDHILAGRYKSRTGLGRGLAGTKRLADRFDIQTGSAGTDVTVEVAL